MWIARPTFMLEALLCDNESHKFSIQHVKGEAGGCSETRTRHNNISYPTPCPLSYMPFILTVMAQIKEKIISLKYNNNIQPTRMLHI